MRATPNISGRAPSSLAEGIGPLEDLPQRPTPQRHEAGVLLHEGEGLGPRLLEKTQVSDRIGDGEAQGPRLDCPRELTGPSDPQILLGQHEAVAAFEHRLEAGLAVLGEVLGVDEETVGLLRPPPHATPELVEGREAEALRVLDHHHRRLGHVDTDLDDAGRHEEPRGAALEGGHRLAFLLFLEP